MNTKDINPSASTSILIVGDSGSWKTRFLGSCPKPYVFDFDNGMMSLRGSDVEYDTFRDAPAGVKGPFTKGTYEWGTAWSAFITKMNDVGSGLQAKKFDYLTLGIDSLSTMAVCALNFVLRNNNQSPDVVRIQDWGAQTRILEVTISQLTSWPILKVLTAHVQRETNELTQNVEKLPLVTGKFAGKVGIYFDEVYFTDVADVKGADNKFVKKYSLITSSTTAIKQAKSRLNVPNGSVTDYKSIEPFLGAPRKDILAFKSK